MDDAHDPALDGCASGGMRCASPAPANSDFVRHPGIAKRYPGPSDCAFGEWQSHWVPAFAGMTAMGLISAYWVGSRAAANPAFRDTQAAGCAEPLPPCGFFR
jgi:hypothetical protein